MYNWIRWQQYQERPEQQTYVSDVKYPEALVGNLNKNIRNVSIGLLVIADHYFAGGDYLD